MPRRLARLNEREPENRNVARERLAAPPSSSAHRPNSASARSSAAHSSPSPLRPNRLCRFAYDRSASRSDASVKSGQSDATSDYIAITILLASRRRLAIKGASSADQLRETLQLFGAVGADDLIALEVIWQPEGAGEVLSSEDLLTAYPHLSHL